jgi:RNA polymerase sigma-70 factor (ECF subfamily)
MMTSIGLNAPRVVAMTDTTEYTRCFRQEFPRVLRTVLLILADHGRAEEVTQDAFVMLLQHWDRVSQYERPDAWVRQVAVRMAGRLARREHRRRLLERHFRSELTVPPPELAGNLAGNEVYRAVHALPPRQRTAVVLFYFEDRPVAEIAEILGCSPATARVHLHKARQRLADRLREELDDVV